MNKGSYDTETYSGDRPCDIAMVQVVVSAEPKFSGRFRQRHFHVGGQRDS